MNKKEKDYVHEVLKTSNLLEQGTFIPSELINEIMQPFFPPTEYSFLLMQLKYLLEEKGYFCKTKKGNLRILGEDAADKMFRDRMGDQRRTKNRLRTAQNAQLSEYSANTAKKIMHETNILIFKLNSFKSSLNEFLG